PCAPRSDCRLTAIFAATWLRSSSADCWNSKLACDAWAAPREPPPSPCPAVPAPKQCVPGGRPPPALIEQIGLRDDVLGGERLEHRNLFLGEHEAAGKTLDCRRSLAGFAPCLVGGRLERRDLAANRGFASDLQFLFALAVGTGAGNILPGAFGCQSRYSRLQRLVLGLEL